MREVTRSIIRSAPAVVMLLLTIPAGPARADDPAPPADAGYVLPETETWELAAEEGEPYRIFVSRPEGPAPDEGYPVLYVLDGNAIFASFAEARRLQAGTHSNRYAKPDTGNSIIVAVGYETDMPFDVRRLYDFTPPMPDEVPPSQQRLAKYPSGGQDRFLDFLVERLRPEVARRYPVDLRRQSLFGHSLGGLFALHVLYTRPHAFEAIIAASPAQYWHEQAILAEERAFARRLSEANVARPVSRVLVLVGEHEENVAMVWDAEALARRLQPLSAFGLRSRFEMLDGEAHVSALPRAITTTLRFAFAR